MLLRIQVSITLFLGANNSYFQGIENSQNTSITNLQSGLSANVAYIAGVDVTQNTSITNLQNALSANLLYIQGVDVSQNSSISGLTIQISSNVAYTQGVDAQQNTWISANNSYFQGVLNGQNTSIGNLNTWVSSNVAYTQGVDAQQNTWISSNVAYFQGIENTQNTNITTATNLAQGGYNKANLSISILGWQPNAVIFANSGGYLANDASHIAFVTSNNTLVVSNISVPTIYTTVGGIVFPDGTTQTTSTYIAPVDLTARAIAQSAFIQANTASNNTVYTFGVDASQNTRISTLEANTIYTFGVDAQQNTNITGVGTFAQAAYNTANTDVTSINTTAGTYGSTTVVPVITLLANGRVSSITNTAISTSAGNLTGTIPNTVLGNSSIYVGTTAVALNRSSAPQTLTGVSIDGNAGTVTNGIYTTNYNSYSPTLTGGGASGSWSISVTGSAGSVAASGITGTIPTATLGSGTANTTTYLRGDNTWQVVSASGGGATITNDNSTNTNYYLGMAGITSGSWTTAYVSSNELYFNPSTGTLNATIFNSLSDISLKDNITSLNNCTDIINMVNPVGYTWKKSGKKSYGVIANELEKILPELVSENDGIKSVEYNSLIAFLIGAVQELSDRIEILENK